MRYSYKFQSRTYLSRTSILIVTGFQYISLGMLERRLGSLFLYYKWENRGTERGEKHHGKSLAEIEKDYSTLKSIPRVCALGHSILPINFVGLSTNFQCQMFNCSRPSWVPCSTQEFLHSPTLTSMVSCSPHSVSFLFQGFSQALNYSTSSFL